MSEPGRLMVLNCNPSPAYAEKLVFPYNGGHFALLTKIEGDRAYLADPLAAAIVISLTQLEKALTTPLGKDPNGQHVAPYNGGILLWESGPGLCRFRCRTWCRSGAAWSCASR